MRGYSGNPAFEHGAQTRTGILLCNLGTPNAPTPAAVRRYLAEFLSDPRVVELPRMLWLPILYGFVLTFRPRRSAAAYAKVWGADGSPLLSIARRQHAAIADALETRHPERLAVELGMRYGEPSIAHALQALRAQNVRDIVVLPLYPQYAGASTGSVMDAVARETMHWRWVPSLRFVSDYHDHVAYIEALAASVRQTWAQRPRGEHFVMSFHGIPQRSFLAGDPYHCQCHTTARLLAERLELASDEWTLCFQSRFGRAAWLQPYAADTLQRLAADGISTIDVICPGFSADCLETLEEIALQYAALFREAGGQALHYIPALNDAPAHVNALVRIVEDNLPAAEERTSNAEERSRMATRAAALKARMQS